MGIRVERQKEKITLIAILLAGLCSLTYYFHGVLQAGILFTHFFYAPIILVSLWWKRKGLAVAIFLAVFLIFSHHFLLRDYVITANDYLRSLMFVVIAFVVATLSERIAKVQEKTAHLNMILRAIGNVNQLIMREKDRDKLFEAACKTLIETRGFYNAWIALFDESRRLVATAQAGLGENFLPMVERLRRGELPACGQKAMSQSAVLVTKDPHSTCTDCPLSASYHGRGSMTVRLECRGKVYGLLAMSVPANFANDEEEIVLVDEVARDIAFALHSIELEEGRKHAEEELREHQEYLEQLVAERTAELSNANEQLKQNISERKRVEEVLRESEERYKGMFNYTKNGVAIYKAINDGEEFIFVDFNRSGEKIDNVSRDELIGKRVTEMFPGVRDFGLFEVFQRVWATAKPEHHPVTMYKDERITGWRDNFVYRLPSGEIVAVYSDETERKHAEEELKKYRDDLEELVEERTRKLEEVNTELESFAYSASHDLRAPLRAMQGFSQALLEDYGDRLDAEGREYAQRIVSSAQRMETLIQDLLDYSRLSRSEIKLKPVNLDSAVEGILTQLDVEIREKDAHISVEKPLPEVLSHSTTLEQVMGNLITNAIRFVPPEVKPNINIWAEERDEVVRLWVEDKGIGISPEHHERIFNIFERLHGVESYPGTGIGLAIVKKGAEKLGGKVGVKSAPGKGSRFWIELTRKGSTK